MGRRRLFAGATCLLLASSLWACDSQSPSTGSYAGSVVGSEGGPGSALLLISGDGLVRVEGAGGTLAWSTVTAGSPDEIRVLLVDPDPTGPLTFRLFVRDRSAPLPTFTFLQLANRENRIIPQDGFQIRIER